MLPNDRDHVLVCGALFVRLFQLKNLGFLQFARLVPQRLPGQVLNQVINSVRHNMPIHPFGDPGLALMTGLSLSYNFTVRCNGIIRGF